jgi:hypothetical protein
MLFNHRQILANIQPPVRVADLSWAITEPQFWLPLFPQGEVLAAPLTLQPAELVFEAPDNDRAKTLEAAIESALVAKIEAVRRMRAPTKWHSRAANARLKSLLGEYETAVLKGQPIDETAAARTLGRIAETSEVIGVPMQMPFTDVATAVDTAIALGVHETYSPGAEFAVAVHVQAYAARALSVWVMVASIVSRR